MELSLSKTFQKQCTGKAAKHEEEMYHHDFVKQRALQPQFENGNDENVIPLKLVQSNHDRQEKHTSLKEVKPWNLLVLRGNSYLTCLRKGVC